MHDMRGDTEEKRKEERRPYTRTSEACRDERRDIWKKGNKRRGLERKGREKGRREEAKR